MPPSKPKPSEIAAEAKKNYIPYIRDNFSDRWPPTSYLCFSDSLHAKAPPRWESGERMNELMYHARFGMLNPCTPRSYGFDTSSAFYERDPVDLAIEWAAGESPIPVIMPAHDKRPGGDWEAGLAYSSLSCSSQLTNARRHVTRRMSLPAEQPLRYTHNPGCGKLSAVQLSNSLKSGDHFSERWQVRWCAEARAKLTILSCFPERTREI